MAVTGIGGFFFRARDPEALRGWYRTHLGVGGDGYHPWEQAAGPTMFLPFASSTDYWPADKPWLLNLRVNDLDAVVTRLNAAGIAVATDPAWDSPEAGRFARIHDPESNPIELWEPAGDGQPA